jgi:hypothetical protein
VKVNVIYKKNVKVNVIYKTKWKTKDTALSEQFQNQIEKSKKQTKLQIICHWQNKPDNIKETLSSQYRSQWQLSPLYH